MRLQCRILALYTPNRNKTQKDPKRNVFIRFSVDELMYHGVKTRVVSPQKTAKELYTMINKSRFRQINEQE